VKIRSDGGQVAIGNTVGGDLVQSGSGQQVALGNDVAGDLVQDGGEEGQ
jgi:hypothetical protein